MKTLTTVCVASAMFLSACATAPENIAPASVSSLQYSNLSCNQLRMEAARINSDLSLATTAQANAASNDAAMTAVSLILFWPAAFFIGGGDDAGVAKLKGEANAIRAAAIQKGC